MLFDTNKNKGKAGLALAIAYFGSNGYNVSIPLNDTQDYDLIIDDGITLKRVSVKSTGATTEYGIYIVALRSFGGTKGIEYARVGQGSADCLFVLCGNGDMFFIPKEIYGNQASMNLGEKVKDYRVSI